MENYQFDEQLINQGWSQMEQVLDKEMPTKQKRKRPFVWWRTSGVLMAAGVAAVLFFYQNESVKSGKVESESVEYIPNDQNNTTVTHDSKIKTHENQAPKTEFDNHKAFVQKSTSAPKNSLQKPFFIPYNHEASEAKTSISQKSNFSQKIENQTINNLTITKNTDKEVFVENKNQVNEYLSEPIRQSPADSRTFNEKIEQPQQLQNRYDSLNTPILKYSNTQVFEQPQILNKVPLKKVTAMRANGLRIGIFASLTNGYNFGATVKKTWAKHSLSFNLSKEGALKYSAVYRSTKAVDMNGIATYPVVFPVTDTSFAQGFSFDASNAQSIPNYFLFLWTDNIGLGFEHNYKMGKRWETVAGIEYLQETSRLSYYIEEINSSPAFSNKVIKDSYADDTTVKSGQTAALSSTGNFSSSISPSQNIAIRKNIFYLNYGVSRYFGKNLKMSAYYRRGLTNITPNAPSDAFKSNNSFALRMTYYFPLRKY